MNKKFSLLAAPLMVLPLLANCGPKETPWYLDNEYLSSLKEEDVNKNGGIVKTVKINGQMHRVRLIGVDHDELADGSGNKAHTTWEFSNYICDSEGYSLATPWNIRFAEKSNAQDYPKSNLRKALEGEGPAELVWYEKGSATKSTKYTKTVLDMLPNDLQGVLKKVKKNTVVSSEFKVESFDTKLFPLAYYEMTATSDAQASKDEGTIYSYYKGMAHDKDISRFKHQIKWQDGAASDSTKISDIKFETPGIEVDNFAGFNSNVRELYGGYCWLRSPVATATANSAFQLAVAGTFLKYQVYMYTLAVAPAFCI